MIYLDVTDSCKSPMNTGIQRVARGLFRAFKESGEPIIPLLWDAKLGAYCALSREEHNFLERPFAANPGRGLAEPGRAANRIPVLSQFKRRLAHRRNRIDLGSMLKAADCVLVPQIFRDRRGVYLSELANISKAQRVVFFFDAIPWKRPDVTRPSNVTGVVEYMTALAKFDVVITASQEAAEDLHECWDTHLHKGGIFPGIHVLHWPPDEMFRSNRVKPVELPKEYQTPRILCVGTLEPRKNHLTLLAAAERLWCECGLAFQLEIVGRITPDFGEKVVTEIERLRRAGRPVAWQRHIDNDTLLKAYDACAFTVYPTLLEGFGLPIIESLSRGKPCVCGANGALGELAKGGGCLTVDQTDAGALEDGMQRLLTDQVLYRRLCNEARARTFETWPSFVTKLMALLTSTASTK